MLPSFRFFSHRSWIQLLAMHILKYFYTFWIFEIPYGYWWGRESSCKSNEIQLLWPKKQKLANIKLLSLTYYNTKGRRRYQSQKRSLEILTCAVFCWRNRTMEILDEILFNFVCHEYVTHFRAFTIWFISLLLTRWITSINFTSCFK